MKRLLPQYSHGRSRTFWHRVHSIKNEDHRSAAYLLGCELQNFEGAVLRIVNLYAENRPTALDMGRLDKGKKP